MPSFNVIKRVAQTFARFTGAPIIIGGCGRSGTTLLASVLSCHPRIAVIGPETRAFCKGAYPADRPAHDAPFDLQSLLPHLEAARPGAMRWCEKTPRNVHTFERIVRLFDGRVHLLHIVRDGRDVACSFHPDDPRQPWISPERWVQDVRAGLRVAHLPQVHTLRYEDLVHRFEATMSAVAKAIGEPDPEPFFRYPEGATVIEHAAWSGRAQKVNKVSAGRWLRPENHAYAAGLLRHPDAQALLQASGYGPEPSAEPPAFEAPAVPPSSWTEELKRLPGAGLGSRAVRALTERLQGQQRHRAASKLKRAQASVPLNRSGACTQPAVFMMGPACGGRDVLSLLLHAHPQLHVLPEDGHVLSRVAAFAAPQAYRQLADQLKLGPDVRWVDPSYDNLAFAATLRTLFKNAMFLVVTRTEAEMVHSLTGRLGNRYAAGVQVKSELEQALQIARWPQAMHVQEPELRRQPQAILQRILNFLNLPGAPEVSEALNRITPHLKRLEGASEERAP